MVDTNALKERITESGMSVASISKKTGILRETFYNHIKSGDFKISEMCASQSFELVTKRERRDFFAKNRECYSIKYPAAS